MLCKILLPIVWDYKMLKSRDDSLKGPGKGEGELPECQQSEVLCQCSHIVETFSTTRAFRIQEEMSFIKWL